MGVLIHEIAAHGQHDVVALVSSGFLLYSSNKLINARLQQVSDTRCTKMDVVMFASQQISLIITRCASTKRNDEPACCSKTRRRECPVATGNVTIHQSRTQPKDHSLDQARWSKHDYVGRGRGTLARQTPWRSKPCAAVGLHSRCERRTKSQILLLQTAVPLV